MERPNSDYLTTKELADLLRIKERKVYNLAASGDVPCVRVVGKLLFPRTQIEAWMAAARSGPDAPHRQPPAIVVGSHDPLLDWALRESGSGLAAFFDGSHDGLGRMAGRGAVACGLHIHQDGGWNVSAVSQAFGQQPVVLVEFARRERGLIVAAKNPHAISGIADLAGLRFARRQASAASQTMFEDLALQARLDISALQGPPKPARTEDDLARLVLDGKADAGLGLASVATQLGLGFVPLTQERFDLLVWRQAWFEPPFQKLLNFARSAAFQDRAAEMQGYDVSEFGTVHFNGP
ncbi:MAG: substrate-binding domain-containing protein [Paracoccaceae bacterium]